MGERVTVQQFFETEKIDLTFLEEMEDGSPYWESCLNFVTENWRRRIETLSVKQAAWVSKILEDCVEKRIEGRQ